MAVPKKKRYRQYIRVRRSLQKSNLIAKKNLVLTKFLSYINIFAEPNESIYCAFCKNDKREKVNKFCANCYIDFFAPSFLPKKEIKDYRQRQRNYFYKYYVKLSTTLIPPRRP